MIEEAIAFLAGAALTGLGVAFWPRKADSYVLPMEETFEGTVIPRYGENGHSHQLHVSGTTVVEGVKHIRKYCSKCKEEWEVPA